MPPSRPSLNCSVWPHLSATCCNTRTAWQVTSVPIPSPGRTRMLRFICRLLLLGDGGDCLLALFDQSGNFLIEDTFLTVRKSGELMINVIELFFAQDISELL